MRTRGDKLNGFAGLFEFRELDYQFYADESNALDTIFPEGVNIVTQDPVTKQYLLTINNVRILNNLITKEQVMQQARGISGNLFLSPVAKIKAIVNKITPVIGDNES